MNKYIYIATVTIIRSLLRIIPRTHFKNNRIIFVSYLGKQYSCNPKYICEYILNHETKYELVWAFKKPIDYYNLQVQKIQLVKYNSLKFIFLCLNSKYIITNTRDLLYIPFNSKQIIINTWHGGGAYKKVGASKETLDVVESFRQSIFKKMPVVFLSSSKIFSELTLKKSFHHNGIILNSGMPRNDILINNSAEFNSIVSQTIKKKYQIPMNNKILLYAPTYRSSRKTTNYTFDTELIKNALRKRFNGNWSILFRSHYYITEQLKETNFSFIDVSDYSDMQELLLASDVLLTDYSSSIWDYSFTNRPCFLYATDLTTYELEQGFYTNIDDWPFPLAQNNYELERNILSFNESEYIKKIQIHHKTFGSYDNGSACQQVLNFIDRT